MTSHEGVVFHPFSRFGCGFCVSTPVGYEKSANRCLKHELHGRGRGEIRKHPESKLVSRSYQSLFFRGGKSTNLPQDTKILSYPPPFFFFFLFGGGGSGVSVFFIRAGPLGGLAGGLVGRYRGRGVLSQLRCCSNWVKGALVGRPNETRSRLCEACTDFVDDKLIDRSNIGRRINYIHCVTYIYIYPSLPLTWQLRGGSLQKEINLPGTSPQVPC